MFHFTYGVRTSTPTVAQSRAATSLETQKATLFSLHDEIAALKAEWDANKSLSDENLIRVLKSKPSITSTIHYQIRMTLTILFCSRLRKMKQMNSKFRQVEMAWGPPITLLVFTIRSLGSTRIQPPALAQVQQVCHGTEETHKDRSRLARKKCVISKKLHIFSLKMF